LSISASFKKMLEEMEEDIVVQKKEVKTFLFYLCIVDLGTITDFFR